MKAGKVSRKLRVRLVHWNEAEAAERAERLRALGYEVNDSTLSGPEGFRDLRENPPAAVVIDLGRIPSHGREVGMALRSYKDTRFVPIVFVGGDPEKVKKIIAECGDWDFCRYCSINCMYVASLIKHPYFMVRWIKDKLS